MPRMKLVHKSKIPICRLIEENTDSQASAEEQKWLLRSYLKDEQLEDLLKQRLKQTDPQAYQLLVEIDQRQDRVIDEIFRYAEHIRLINWKSNELLKRYDVERKSGASRKKEGKA